MRQDGLGTLGQVNAEIRKTHASLWSKIVQESDCEGRQSRNRREGNIKMNITGIQCGEVNWTRLAQNKEE